jgi:predicted Zn-dependent protease
LRTAFRIVSAATAFALAFTAAAPAANAIGIIRDSEIENDVRNWSTPLFEAAGLVPDDVQIVLVNDPRLNAFVAGGQRLFLHTGLLLRSDNVLQVVGVIAHETGHIAGGHLARLQDQLRAATATAIAAMVLGIAAAVVARSGEAAGAGIGAGMTLAERNFLAYTRTQESSADQAGLNFLEQNGLSARGMMEFFDILVKQEAMLVSRQDPYIRTHPLTKERTDFVRRFVQQSRFGNAQPPAEWVEQHKRMKAKLAGFIDPVSRTLVSYKEDDRTIASRYARAVALYRKPDLPNALKTIDGLIAEEPQNPYFRELKGQMLFENGRAADSLPEYELAVRYLPKSGLIRVDLARALIEINRPDYDQRAIAHLNEALRQESENAVAWRQLAIAYGRGGNMGMAALSLGEEAMLKGDFRVAIGQAQRAEQLLPVGSPPHLRAMDLQADARREMAARKNN